MKKSSTMKFKWEFQYLTSVPLFKQMPSNKVCWGAVYRPISPSTWYYLNQHVFKMCTNAIERNKWYYEIVPNKISWKSPKKHARRAARTRADENLSRRDVDHPNRRVSTCRKCISREIDELNVLRCRIANAILFILYSYATKSRNLSNPSKVPLYYNSAPRSSRSRTR